MGQIVDISSVLLELGLSDAATDKERAVAISAIARAESAVKRFLRYDPVQRTRTEYYPQSNVNPQSAEAVWEASEGGTTAFLRSTVDAGSSELQLQHLPIRSITSLYIDYDGRAGTRTGGFAAESLKAEGTDYWANFDAVDDDGNKLCRDGIVRSEGMWPATAGTVKIIYVAGYTAAELHGQATLVDASAVTEAVVAEASRRARRTFMMEKKTGVGFVAGTITSENLGDYSYSVDPSSAGLQLAGELMPETKEILSGYVNWGFGLA